MRDKRVSEFSQYLGDDGLAKILKKSVRARQGLINRLLHQLRIELGWESVDQKVWRELDPEGIFELIRSSGRDTVAMQCFKNVYKHTHLNADGQRLGSAYLQQRYAVWGEHDPKYVVAHARKGRVLHSDSTVSAMAAAKGSRSVIQDHVINSPKGEKIRVKKRPTTKG
jgi:hypothetical protein